MKRLPVLIVLLAPLFAACATSKHPKISIPEPGLGLEQVVGPAELGYPYGPIEVKYNFAVQNNAAEPITLIRLDIQSLNPGGGAYTLRRDFHNFHQTIPPNSIGVFPFWVRAMSWGRTLRENEPVTVRGIAYFEAPSGVFQKIFIRDLSQYRN
jgi:hypothetical protein